MTYHVIALYAALDGAHTLNWKRYPPWHHLIDHVSGSAYVNKYRLDTYRSAFGKAFGLRNVRIRVAINNEAQSLLTEKRYEKLGAFTKDELLAGLVELVAAKSVR